MRRGKAHNNNTNTSTFQFSAERNSVHLASSTPVTCHTTATTNQYSLADKMRLAPQKKKKKKKSQPQVEATSLPPGIVQFQLYVKTYGSSLSLCVCVSLCVNSTTTWGCLKLYNFASKLLHEGKRLSLKLFQAGVKRRKRLIFIGCIIKSYEILMK